MGSLDSIRKEMKSSSRDWGNVSTNLSYMMNPIHNYITTKSVSDNAARVRLAESIIKKDDVSAGATVDLKL